VATAGAVAVFFPARPRFALVELGLLTALLAIVAAERVVRIHDRWIDCRLLAERLRSSFFLALTGLNLREHAEGPPGDEPGAFTADWQSQAHEELWRLRPPFAPTEADVPALREYLSAVWIADQIRYHTKRRGRLGRWHQVLHRTAEILFGLTFVAALLHGLERTEGPEIAVSASAHWLTFASIALPAIGAAVDRGRRPARVPASCRTQSAHGPEPGAAHARPAGGGEPGTAPGRRGRDRPKRLGGEQRLARRGVDP